MKPGFPLFFNVNLVSLVLLLFVLLIGCSKDEDPVKQPVTNNPPKDDEDDEEEIVEIPGIVITTSTIIKGDIPTATGEGDLAFVDSKDNLFAAPGNKIKISVPLSPDVVDGFYLKIENADYYYKIPPNETAPSGGRLNSLGRKQGKEEEEITDPYFVLELTDDLEGNELCISYSVYNSQGQVSETVDRCISVLSLGGGTANFLTDSEWEMISLGEFLNGTLINNIVPGEEFDEESHEFEITCSNGTLETITVNYSSLYDYLHLSFSPNGQGIIDLKATFQALDSEATIETCSAVHELITVEQESKILWSFDAAQSRITIMHLDGDGVIEYSDLNDIEQSGDNLIMTYYEEDENEIEQFGFDKQVVTFSTR